jgi:hypothetical protein
MVRQHLVDGIITEGLKISTSGNTLTIQPGRVVVPDGEATLRDARTFIFEPQEQNTYVAIGFDRIGRFFVEWPKPGEEPQAEAKYGVLTLVCYFDLPAGTTDLSDVIVNVVRGR